MSNYVRMDGSYIGIYNEDYPEELYRGTPYTLEARMPYDEACRAEENKVAFFGGLMPETDQFEFKINAYGPWVTIDVGYGQRFKLKEFNKFVYFSKKWHNMKDPPGCPGISRISHSRGKRKAQKRNQK